MSKSSRFSYLKLGDSSHNIGRIRGCLVGVGRNDNVLRITPESAPALDSA